MHGNLGESRLEFRNLFYPPIRITSNYAGSKACNFVCGGRAAPTRMAGMPIARWDPFVRGPTLCAFEERWFILFKKGGPVLATQATPAPDRASRLVLSRTIRRDAHRPCRNTSACARMFGLTESTL